VDRVDGTVGHGGIDDIGHDRDVFELEVARVVEVDIRLGDAIDRQQPRVGTVEVTDEVDASPAHHGLIGPFAPGATRSAGATGLVDAQVAQAVGVVLAAGPNHIDKEQQVLDEPILVKRSQRQRMEVEGDRFRSHEDVSNTGERL